MKRGVLSLGMVGAGKMAFWHLRAYSRLRRVRVAAICNPESDKGVRLAGKYGIPRHYKSYGEMLRQEKLDAVDLCVPTGLHAPFILQALERGLHVYSEKPLALSVEEGERIADANERVGSVIFNGYNLRTWGPVARLSRVVLSGSLGEIRFIRMIRTTFEFPGSFMEKPELNSGIINEFTGHFLDLLQAWKMEEPAEVSCSGSCILGPYGDPDTVSAYLRYPNGAGVLLHNSLGVPGLTPEIVVIGTRGTAWLREGKLLLESLPQAPSISRQVLREFRHAVIPPWRILNNPFNGSTRLFVACVLDKRPNPQDEKAALGSLKLAAHVERAYRAGRSLSYGEKP